MYIHLKKGYPYYERDYYEEGDLCELFFFFFLLINSEVF